MSSQLQVSGEAKIRTIQGPVVANSGVITALDGDASQYVRGDGTLADFPTSTGGGSSVSYYLNSSVSQGTIGGVAYRQLSKTPISGAGTDITASTNGYIANYITDANDPSLLEVPAGNFNCEFYFSVNSNSHNPYVYAELYKYDGTTFTLLGSNQAIPEYLTNGTTLSAYYFAIPVAVAALTITDRLAIRIYVNVDGRVVTLHTENNHLCQVVTTFSKGLTSLNNLTRQVQFLATGTSGTDFNISSSTATHTFNIPVASATNTGKLSSTDWSTFNGKQAALSFTAPLINTSNTISIPVATASVDGYLDNADWTIFNNKQNAITLTTTGTSGAATLVGATLNIPQYTDQFVGTVTSVAALTIGTSGTDLSSSVANSTTTPVITLNVPTASATNRGALSSADWTTFNNKYNLPSLTSGSVLFSNGTTIAQNNANFFWDNTNSFLGVGTNIPSAGVTSFSSTPAFQFKAAGAAPAITFSNTLTSASLACVFGLATSNNHFITGTAAGDMAIANQSTSAGAIVFGTGTFEKMRMTSAGTFSIGNTNSTYNLDVTGTGRFTTTLTANKLVAGNASTDNVAIFTTYDEGKAIQLKSSTGDLLFVPYFNPSTGARIIAQNTAGSAYTPLSFYASNFYFQSNVNFNSTIGNGTYTYTLPSATGTLALTSNLSAYLPLTGGTLTGALSGTSATFSSSIGVGGTLSAWGSPVVAMQVGTASINSVTSGANAGFSANRYFDGSSNRYITDGFASNFTQTNGAFAWFTAPSGTAGGAITFTQAMTITSGGSVGIGTSSPACRLDILGANEVMNIAGTNASSAYTGYYYNTSTLVGYIGNGSSILSGAASSDFIFRSQGALVYATNGNNERMRITSGGAVLMGTTTDNNYRLGVEAAAGGAQIYLTRSGANAQMFMGGTTGAGTQFYISANNSGGVYLPAGGVAWISASDERLKTDLLPIEDAANKVSSLRSVIGRYKTDAKGTKRAFLIAQDVVKVLPEAVNKNVENGDLGVSYTEVIPLLVAAIKELEARIKQLENK